MNDIINYIPHREPFLFVDKILEIDGNTIKTTKFISQKEYFLKGHYPGFPLIPGVLICEAVLQSGAILLAHILQEDIKDEIPVVTRMNNVKLKRMVLPGSNIEMRVELVDKISGAFYLKGTVRVESNIVAYLEFACGLVKKGETVLS